MASDERRFPRLARLEEREIARRMDIDSILIVSRHPRDFAPLLHMRVDFRRTLACKCENKKMIDSLKVTEDINHDRFCDFLLGGYGQQKLFVLVEWPKADSHYHNARGWYLDEVVRPAVDALPECSTKAHGCSAAAGTDSHVQIFRR